MKRVFLYCDERSLNDATVYYISIVNDCLIERGYSVQTVYRLSDIIAPNLIFTVTDYCFCKAKLKFPRIKTINWKQGVGFEEAKMIRPFYKWIPFYLCEFISLHFSDMQLFVSDIMAEYYRKYFLYRGDNHIIMPCYNLKLATFRDLERYNSPSFVYAGGVSKWQGIDVLLDTYAIVERNIPKAKLVMLSNDRTYILNEANKRGIKNITVKYLPLSELQNELQKYKYGFILRERNWVNLVATPTKMNSYLAAYLIPIFSDGVNDFDKNIDLGQFTIKAKTPLDSRSIAEQILAFENSHNNYQSYPDVVAEVFNRHYNDTDYKEKILNMMLQCGI